MPVLKDIRQTKVIALPSFPGSEVEIYSSLLVADVLDIDPINTQPVALAMQGIPKFIKRWNMTDEAEKPMPVSAEAVKLLPQADVERLVSEIVKFGAEVGKKGEAS